MFKTIIQPRVSETDGVGHINNTTVPVWFEAGRNELFKIFTPDLSFANWKLVIVNTSIDYVSQIYYGKEVEVRIWVQKIGNSSLVLHEEMHQNDKLCAKSRTTYVNFNLAEQKSEPIPQQIREQLTEHMLEIHTAEIES
ncbi:MULTISPECIES: acyl-CoA thioesterase [Aneurinibacillus]|jgi:acyl-CoA thioester hydrolase|uniref:Thioesterase n=1 Tax=Aneurinibacillus danicus TaxID=267746 RepID=A0A511V3W0_9BACL|nr:MULTISPECIES: thioesterase family protein [Aneurinibacillus]GEN33600.1 thioesterase [Aneurinibacillus danicus]